MREKTVGSNAEGEAKEKLRVPEAERTMELGAMPYTLQGIKESGHVVM